MGLNFNVQANLLFLNIRDYSKRIQEHIETCMRQSVRAAVKAAAGPEFPVQTGMAKATWRAVGQSSIAGKGIRTSVSIRPTRNPEAPRRGFPEGKSIDSGISRTKIFFSQQGFKFRFTVFPGALHYRRGYFADASTSLSRARVAFRETMRACYIRNFPKLRASIRTKRA